MKNTNPFETLKFDIISRAGLSSQAATGFYPIHCPICNKQGKKTGGFKFETDKIVYNCFRSKCDASTVFEVGNPVPRKFKALMEAIHVDIPIEFRMKKSSEFKKSTASLDANLYKQHYFNQIEKPKEWKPLKKSDSFYRYFLERRIDPSGFFKISSGDYKGNVAIPLYYYDRIISFQIATKYKYISFQEGNTNTLAIHSGIIRNPTILVEGVLDALCFPNAVGIMKAKISPEQAYFLRDKDVILFPDKGAGGSFMKMMKAYGWKMVVPPWRDVKDLNDCVVKYGKLITARMIREHIYTDPMKAAVAYRVWSGNK